MATSSTFASKGASDGGHASKSAQIARYVMPVETAVHSHTIMGFPSEVSTEGPEWTAPAQVEVVNIANSIAKFQPVHLYARAELLNKAETMIGPNVVLKEAIIDQLWVRDSGPIYVQHTTNQSSGRTGVCFNFNYWGSKLPRTGDENIAEQITILNQEPSIRSSLTTEGGAIEIDGQGTFLATESSIINDNRNPGMSKTEVEQELRRTLGVKQFIWIPGVKGYDITDYHIDALARFVRPGVVILSKPAPSADEIVQKVYREAKDILSSSTNARGERLTVHDCEEPDTDSLGEADPKNETVASYVNYLLVNGAVIMAKFGQEPHDGNAFTLFKRLFPDREVVQVLINTLPRMGGGIHCATQQVPLL